MTAKHCCWYVSCKYCCCLLQAQGLFCSISQPMIILLCIKKDKTSAQEQDTQYHNWSRKDVNTITLMQTGSKAASCPHVSLAAIQCKHCRTPKSPNPMALLQTLRSHHIHHTSIQPVSKGAECKKETSTTQGYPCTQDVQAYLMVPLKEQNRFIPLLMLPM